MNHVFSYHSFLRGMVAGLLTLTSQVDSRAKAYKATADIRFHGTSTLHDFEGKVSTGPFQVNVRQDPVKHLLVVNASVEVKVADMTTNRRRRDKNMYKMLDLTGFAVIQGAVKNAVVPAEGQGGVKLSLRIRDQSRVVDAKLSDWKVTSEGVSFDLAFPVSLKAFGLKPPVALGFIRVGDGVRVQCKVGPPRRQTNSLTPKP